MKRLIKNLLSFVLLFGSTATIYGVEVARSGWERFSTVDGHISKLPICGDKPIMGNGCAPEILNPEMQKMCDWVFIIEGLNAGECRYQQKGIVELNCPNFHTKSSCEDINQIYSQSLCVWSGNASAGHCSKSELERFITVGRAAFLDHEKLPWDHDFPPKVENPDEPPPQLFHPITGDPIVFELNLIKELRSRSSDPVVSHTVCKITNRQVTIDRTVAGVTTHTKRSFRLVGDMKPTIAAALSDSLTPQILTSVPANGAQNMIYKSDSEELANYNWDMLTKSDRKSAKKLIAFIDAHCP